MALKIVSKKNNILFFFSIYMECFFFNVQIRLTFLDTLFRSLERHIKVLKTTKNGTQLLNIIECEVSTKFCGHFFIFKKTVGQSGKNSLSKHICEKWVD